MGEPDLLKNLAAPVLDAARGLIPATALPAPLVSAWQAAIEYSGAAAVAGGWFGLAIAEQRMRGRPQRRRLALFCAVVAGLLAVWLVRHPSDRFDNLFLRWDHLAFAATAGLAITILAGSWRKWCLASLGTGTLFQYAGPTALAVAIAMTGIGVALLGTSLRRNYAAMATAQILLVVTTYGGMFWVRGWNLAAAAEVQALLAFWLLRHISLIVAAVRSGPPSLADCGAFLTFYPGTMGLLGAPEMYSEFARRNLSRAPVVQHRRAARRLLEGLLLLVMAPLLPVSMQQVEASTTLTAFSVYGVGLFVRTALMVMGAWRCVDATALLYGVQLRANFAGLLTCRNPSELWWSWRGTMTNWLVQFVYAPLGGSQRHQALNIAAAFTVSFLWHALGVPFLTPEFRWYYVLPLALWAAINGMAVIAHVYVARARAPLTPAFVPLWVRTTIATVLTWSLGALTPILLSYQGRTADRLFVVLRHLAGSR